MRAYWDASAMLALIFAEPHSAAAARARAQTSAVFAWSWARVELAAGCARRRASKAQRGELERLLADAHWHDIATADYANVARANETWRLRAADAGHLYALQTLLRADPEITLVCFDQELLTAARAEKLRVWSP